MTTRLTREQAAIIGTFTGILCGPFQDMHAYVEKIMQRPVFTHELAHPGLCERLRELSLNDFISICAQESEQ